VTKSISASDPSERVNSSIRAAVDLVKIVLLLSDVFRRFAGDVTCSRSCYGALVEEERVPVSYLESRLTGEFRLLESFCCRESGV
jgi:hypothetical protein